MSDLAFIKLPPKPTVIELIGRYMLTPSEMRQVYGGHDDGDAEPRHHVLFVCSIRRGRTCGQDPSHWGLHDWQAP